MFDIDPLLFGWKRGEALRDWPYQQEHFVPFMDTYEAEDPDYRPSWEYAKRITGGKHLPTWYQETGDCVSMGMHAAIENHHAYQIERLRLEQKLRLVYPPYIFYTSRMKPDCGNGRLGRSSGSTGAWAIQAVREYGVLFCDDDGVPPYSGKVADAWGQGKGDLGPFERLAADNPILKSAKLERSSEVRSSLLSNKQVTYAIGWRYGTTAVEHKGYRVLNRGRENGGHQVALIAWMDEPFPAAYMQNSWGTSVHQGPDNGEPTGGAWIRAEDIDRDMADNFTEVFCLSQLQGEPGAPDYGGL